MTRTPKSHRLAADGYVLSNPLSGGELVLIGITGIIGYGLADFVGRYMETTPVTAGLAVNSIPTGATVGNDIATQAMPSWQSMAAKFGVAAVPGIAAAFVDSPWGRAALQGAMLGAGFSLFGDLFKSAMASLIGSTPLGQQLYLAEYEAQQMVAQAAPATSTTTTSTMTTTTSPGVAGLPRGVGKRPPVGAGQTRLPNPAGYVQAPPGILTNTGAVLPTPPAGTSVPGGPSTGPMCAPCTSTQGGIAATVASANDAIRDESCLGGLPTMYSTFPHDEAA